MTLDANKTPDAGGDEPAARGGHDVRHGASHHAQSIVPGSSDPDVIVARCSELGVLGFVRKYPSAGEQVPLSVRVDAATGTIWIVGKFSGSLPGPNGTTLSSAGGFDAFVLGIDASGAIVSAARFGGPGDDVATGLVPLPNGHMAVVGSFFQTADFGPFTKSSNGRGGRVRPGRAVRGGLTFVRRRRAREELRARMSVNLTARIADRRCPYRPSS